MKLHKYIFTLFLLTSCLAVSSQPSLNEAIKSFIQSTPSAIKCLGVTNSYLTQTNAAAMLFDYDETKSEQLVEKYMKEEMADDLAETLAPYMEKHINLEELNELTTKMMTEKGQLFQSHWRQANLVDSLVENMVTETINKIMSGDNATPIQVLDCPDNYKQLFMQFYKEMGEEDLFLAKFDIADIFFDSEQSVKWEKIKQSIKDNHRTLQLNKSYGNMTDDDLKFGLELFQTPAWKNQIKAMKEVMNHPGEFSMVFTRKNLNWLKKQGIEMEHMSPLLSE